MCLSRVGQIVFGALALVAAALILASMFTKGWKEFRAKVVNAGAVGGVEQTVMSVGIFPFACSGLNVTQGYPQVVDANGNPVSGTSVDYCKQ